MIGKAPATGAGFKGLINYLMLGKLAEQNPDRVAWSDVRNLAVEDPHLVPRIMRSTAKQAILCEKPVYHLVVSWHKDENPTEQAMRVVADNTLADLELLDHQTLLVAHHDTDHHHLHLVINRVHPETGKAWDRWQDWPRIEKSLGRQAQEMGFMFVPGRHNQPEAFRDTAKHPRNSERQRAERLGTTDQLRDRWTDTQIAAKRPRLAQTFEHAGSWAELDRALAADGLDIARKGQGLVIGDADGTTKLSQLRKDIRLKGLEDRFGESFAEFDQRRQEERRQAEMNRTERMAERQRQLDARVATKVASSAEEASAQDEPPAENATAKPPPAKERSVQTDDHDTRYETLAQARAEADLAHTLHGAGLVTKAQLRSAIEAKERAQEEVDKHKTLKERFERELIDALTPKKPDPEPREREVEEPEPKAKRRDKKHDRER